MPTPAVLIDNIVMNNITLFAVLIVVAMLMADTEHETKDIEDVALEITTRKRQGSSTEGINKADLAVEVAT